MKALMNRIGWELARACELPPEDDDASWLSPGELVRVAGMKHPKRRLEFRLGRWGAKRALGTLLRPDAPAPNRVEIAAAEDGAPLVLGLPGPAPQISISHREGCALCAVSPAGLAIGCDLERIEAHSEGFLQDFFTRAERARVADAGRYAWLAAALIWSFKESCLKALRTGLRRDTRGIEVALPEPAGPKAAATWRPLVASDLEAAGEGAEFSGWWRAADGFVLTVAARGNADAPYELR